MKYLQVKVLIVDDIAAARKAGQPTMIYPDGYMDVNFVQAGYIETGSDLYVLGAAEDSHKVDALITQPNVTVLSKIDAVAFSEANEKREIKINDDGKVRYIELKVARNESLTADELKSIDPADKTEKGFEYTEILADKFQPLAKETAMAKK